MEENEETDTEIQILGAPDKPTHNDGFNGWDREFMDPYDYQDYYNSDQDKVTGFLFSSEEEEKDDDQTGFVSNKSDEDEEDDTRWFMRQEQMEIEDLRLQIEEEAKAMEAKGENK